MANAIFESASSLFSKGVSKVSKHSPEILVVSGIVGGIAAAVVACKATTKASEILEEAKIDIDAIHTVAENEEFKDQYTQDDVKKDLTITYAKTGIKIAKAYAPAVAIGVVSIACILKSHDILNKRNVAIAAAYATIDKSYREYRNRVIDRFGERVDKELKYGIKAKKVTETVIDEETGKEKKVKKTIDVVEDPNVVSEYARFFEEYTRDQKGNVVKNMCWENNNEMNLVFLKNTLKWANKQLKSRGHLLLHEVYDALGFPRSKASMVVGWIYDENNPIGDNKVTFGIYENGSDNYSDFIYNDNEAILLDFNVDGVIIDRI